MVIVDALAACAPSRVLVDAPAVVAITPATSSASAAKAKELAEARKALLASK